MWTNELLGGRGGRGLTWTLLHQDHLFPASQKSHYSGRDIHMLVGGVPIHHYLLLIVLPLIKLPWIWLSINSQVRCWQYYIWESAWTSDKSNISQCCPWRITSYVSLCKMQIFQWQLPSPPKKKWKRKQNQALAEVCVTGSPRTKQMNQVVEMSPPHLLWAAASLGDLCGLQNVFLHFCVCGDCDTPLGLVPH